MSTDSSFSLPADSRPGRVALRMSSLDRVVPFYREVVGLNASREGDRVRFEAGSTPLLELQEAPDAPERGPGEAGLFHVAFRYPDRAALADRLEGIQVSAYRLTGASDHNVSEALYLRDPEGNGVELYRDRPRDAWPRTADGGVEIDTLPLDLDDLVQANADEGTTETTGDGIDRSGIGADDSSAPAETTVGHVHLEATDLVRSEGFYVDDLGLNVQARYGDSASFLAAGDYHHHLGLNTWNGRDEPAGSGRGLAWFELLLPDAGTLDTVANRLAERGRTVDRGDDRVIVSDPDGIELRLSKT